MNDKDLLYLCKKVYERTGWEVTRLKPLDLSGDPYTTHYIDGVFQTYIYTSDYLLEKLPKELMVNDDKKCNRGKFHKTNTKCFIQLIYKEKWIACYIDDFSPTYLIPYLSTSDTPLKALLKLTLALHEAGELNER